MRNLESNETFPSSLLQKLNEIQDFKNGIWKKAFLRKWLFKILVIFQQIFVLKQCTFVQERNVLSKQQWMSYKSSHYFLSESIKIWKSDILTLSPKSGYISLSRIGNQSLFSEKYKYEETLQIKVVQHRIVYKKVSGRSCLSLSRVELGAWKVCHLWNIIMYKNEKLDSVWGSTQAKICIRWETASK